MQPLSPPALRNPLTEKFHALLDECDLVADHSAYGETLNDMEEFFLSESQDSKDWFERMRLVLLSEGFARGKSAVCRRQ